MRPLIKISPIKLSGRVHTRASATLFLSTLTRPIYPDLVTATPTPGPPLSVFTSILRSLPATRSCFILCPIDHPATRLFRHEYYPAESLFEYPDEFRTFLFLRGQPGVGGKKYIRFFVLSLLINSPVFLGYIRKLAKRKYWKY